MDIRPLCHIKITIPGYFVIKLKDFITFLGRFISLRLVGVANVEAIFLCYFQTAVIGQIDRSGIEYKKPVSYIHC